MSEMSIEDEISLLKLLPLPPDLGAKELEEMLKKDSDNIIRPSHILGDLRNKKSEILNRINNDLTTESDFKKTCTLYENIANHSLFKQAYKEYINAYQQLTSLYYARMNNKGINLYKYDTESEKEYIKIFESPYKKEADIYLTIRLPNGELFIHGLNKEHDDSFAFIIDRNHELKKLPIRKNEFFRSGIYFNNNIYCSGYNIISGEIFMRFDFDENRWVKLAPFKSQWGNIIIFNGNILTSLELSYDLLLYSIDIDSFSGISYSKTEKISWDCCTQRHILINLEERLYLFENNGWIYESAVNDEYSWKKVSFSGLNLSNYQVCYSYNKGGIYFLLTDFDWTDNLRTYFKFNLGKKTLTEIAIYDDYLAVKRSNDKLKVIEGYRQGFKLDSDEIKITYSIDYIFEGLKEIENLNKDIKRYPNRIGCHQAKGNILRNLFWYIEAIECYNKELQLDSKNADVWTCKGNALFELGRNLEALECYNKATQLNASDHWIKFYKGLVLNDLGRNIEAIECYDEFIKIVNNYAYFDKGVALHDLGRDDEAMECYNIAISHSPCYPRYFFNRACLLSNLGQEEKAIQDFNSAYFSLMRNSRSDGTWMYNCLKFIKMLSKLLKSTIKFKNEIEKLKNSSLNNIFLVKEIEEKESIIKEKNMQLMERAVKYMDFYKNMLIEIEQLSKEISEHQKWITDIVKQLSSFISS